MLHKKKVRLAAAAAAALAVGALWMHQANSPSCATVEAREPRLEEAMPSGSGWNLVSEQEMGGYLIGGAVDAGGQSALAVFAPEGEGYALQQAVSYGTGVARDTVRIDGTWYNLAWFGGEAAAWAEVTYTVNGKTLEPCRYDTTEMPVLCLPAPSDRYSVSVRYYDSGGNVCF